ncbi:MAG: pilus (MSHA type) biogenesis protein MshL [Gammaproteobacteria bacterium]|nr:pilus (MSHA type) biogenesis protein MshL [Gammaproteobacteria bacterium]
MIINRTLQIFFWPLLLMACSSSAVREPYTLAQIEHGLEQDIGHNQKQLPAPVTPGNVANALVPPIELNLPSRSGVDTEARFDLKVDHSDARAFFMGLVEGTAYNMVVHPRVKGQISLDLKNVSVDEVMEAVRSVYGFDYEKTQSTYHVFPDAVRTRIFKVDYLDVKRSGTSKLKVSSGQVTQTAASSHSSSSGGSSGGSAASRETVSASSIDTASDSDFWKELSAALTTLVGKDKDHNVVISPQSGVIVVRAMPDELHAVEHYLKTTQAIMQRQVLLEAKVIEVILSDGYQTGINWSALKNTSNNQLLVSQIGGGTVFTSGSSDIVGNSGTLNPGNLTQVESSATSAFGGMFTAALHIGQNFAAFLELLKTQGDVQVLSSPQVATMNNQKAVIKVGTDEFFVTNVDSNTNTSTGTSSTQNNVELTPFFSGVSLDVIPQISEDDNITLHVHPTVVDVTERVKNISVSSSTTLSVPLAVSAIRESDTVIRAKSGQVVIIGGLMKNKKANDDASVPLLSDIPLLGNLFRHNKQVMIKSELVILLKPTVVEDGAQWVQSLRQARERLRSMYPANDKTVTTTEAVAIP